MILCVLLFLPRFVSAKEISQKIPTLIFCFHDIGGKGRYSITRHELLQIFDLIKDRYQVLSLKNWHTINTATKEESHSKKTSSKPIVILTFDDGFPSLFEMVIPILERYQFQATFFIYLNRYSTHSTFYKKLAQLPEYFEIGSHSFTHKKLSSKSPNIFKELYLSRKKLESLIQKKIISWAWPYGHYTPELLEQARHAGYILQVSTDYSLVKPGEHYDNIARYTIQRPRPVKRVKAILKHYRQYLLRTTKKRQSRLQKK